MAKLAFFVALISFIAPFKLLASQLRNKPDYSKYNNKKKSNKTESSLEANGKSSKSTSVNPQITHEDLIQSTVIDPQKVIGEQFLIIKQQAVNDNSLPLVGHIALNKKAGKNTNISYIKLGLKQKDFTSKDLLWVFEQYKKPEDNNKEIYNLFFYNNINNSKRNNIFDLIKAVNIHKEDRISDNTKHIFSNKSHSEFNNILVRLIEMGYVDIFEAIISNWISEIEIANIISTKRQERFVVEPGYFYNSYEYAEKEYTLLEYLMRSYEDNYHLYMSRDLYAHSKNNFYIEAVKILLKYELENTDRMLNGLMLSAAALLARQNDLPENIHLELVIDRLGNFDGIVVAAIPKNQRLEICEHLRNYQTLHADWEKLLADCENAI